MKRAMLALGVLLFVGVSSFALSGSALSSSSAADLNLPQREDSGDCEGRGGCSWHGGVCGCRGARAVCCDGTLSPSCGC